MFGFGRLKDVNESINTLTDQLQLARGEAAKYREAANMWKATARQISDELEEARPLIHYAQKRKASLAAYERKRGRG